MRCAASLILLLTIIIGCSKEKPPRTNFAELTIDGKKFVFDQLDAYCDTSADGITCNFQVTDQASNSTVTWEITSGERRINASYKYPGELFPGRSLVFLHLQTYIDRVPGTYNLQNNSFKVLIDESENGRMHGTFSGTLICYTCIPYGTEVRITNGEFEMPYSYR